VADSIGTSGVVNSAPRFASARTLMSNLLFGTRFVTIWIAVAVLLVVCLIVAPSTLSSSSWSTLLPRGSVIVVVALGQMLVIMMGGIDLSMGASISLLANVMVGVSQGADDRLARGVIAVLICAVLIGLVNGVLVAIVELNPLIVTLSTGLILEGITYEYRIGIANNSKVPDSLSDAVLLDKVFGISKTFWFVLAVVILLALVLRSSTFGRRFQAVGANRRAAWMAGIHVRSYVVAAYVGAAIAAGLAGILIGGIVVSPGVNPGEAYLLGPVAAVVLAGAALSGGLASPTSTWVAAFFVTILNHMLKVLGLDKASQDLMFGLAIILGMVISGDRIAELIGRLMLRPSFRGLILNAEGAEARGDPAHDSPAPVPRS
jgi:ribose transport system permease protein